MDDTEKKIIALGEAHLRYRQYRDRLDHEVSTEYVTFDFVADMLIRMDQAAQKAHRTLSSLVGPEHSAARVLEGFIISDMNAARPSDHQPEPTQHVPEETDAEHLVHRGLEKLRDQAYSRGVREAEAKMKAQMEERAKAWDTAKQHIRSDFANRFHR